MRASCVECHNTHPQTPRDGWKTVHVRGVLEVIHPMDAITEQTRAGTVGAFVMVGGIAFFGVT